MKFRVFLKSTIAWFLVGILILPAQIFSQDSPAGAGADVHFAQVYDFIQKIQTPELFENARGQVAELKRAFPGSPYSVIAEGELKFTESQFFNKAASLEEASVLAQRAVKLDSSIADSYILLSKIAAVRRNAFEASRLADKALAISPGKPESMFAKGRSEQVGGNFQDAATWYRKAADAFVDPIRKSNALAWVNLALNDDERVPADKKMDRQKIEVALREALQLNPSHFFVRSTLGCFLIHAKGDPVAARKVLLDPQARRPPLRLDTYCLALSDYLEWANQTLKGSATTSPDSIASRTGLSIEDAFTGAALGEGLAPVITAMVRKKTVRNLNTIGSGNQRKLQDCCPAIVNAASAGNFGTLKELVQAGANVNADGDAGRPALIYAVFSADVNMVDFLLQKGARPNVRSQDGLTPIYVAAILAKKNKVEMMKLLLKYKANPVVQSPDGLPLPMLAASLTGQQPGMRPDILRTLIEVGKVDANFKDDKGNPLIATAVYDSEQVRFLLSRGASPWGSVHGTDLVEFYEARKSSPPSVVESLRLIKDARKKVKQN